MPNERVMCTDQIQYIIDPLKTVSAISARNIPPTICLACRKSDSFGQCQVPHLNIDRVKKEWQDNMFIDKDFNEEVIPNTPISAICSRFKK